MVEAPKYNSENRKRRKLTDEILLRLEEILEEERQKDKLLGIHKQQKTKKQIHEQLVIEGYSISLSTINGEINRLRKEHKECFIRQKYELGDRLEYDFGEVKLEIAGVVRTYHMAYCPPLEESIGGHIYIQTREKKCFWTATYVFLRNWAAVTRKWSTTICEMWSADLFEETKKS